VKAIECPRRFGSTFKPDRRSEQRSLTFVINNNPWRADLDISFTDTRS